MFANACSGKTDTADAMWLKQKLTFHNGCRVILLPDCIEFWHFVYRQVDSRLGAYWIDAQTVHRIIKTL